MVWQDVHERDRGRRQLDDERAGPDDQHEEPPSRRAHGAQVDRNRHERSSPASGQVGGGDGRVQSHQTRPAEEPDAAEQEERRGVQHDRRGKPGQDHVRKPAEGGGTEQPKDHRAGENVRCSGGGHEDGRRPGDRQLRLDAADRSAVGEAPIRGDADHFEAGDQ